MTRLPDVPAASLCTIDVPGDGFEAGERYGAACAGLIAAHLEMLMTRIGQRLGLDADAVFARTGPYRDATVQAYPLLAAEVDGVARGAGIPAEAAWALQLRAELTVSREDAMPECTSLAVHPPATAEPGTLAAQNVDLPPAYGRLLVCLRRQPTEGPALLTVTPAGQLGHHGMNTAGVAVFANFLHSAGWRVGVPRYLYTRIVLAEEDRDAAVAAVERTQRAAPRNVLVADPAGATNLETTSTDSERLEHTGGILVHSNHYVSRLREREESPPALLRNSRRRLDRIRELLRERHGAIDVAAIADALRDRRNVPDAICDLPSDDPAREATTVASSIADVEARRLWVALGPPCDAAYQPYEVAA